MPVITPDVVRATFRELGLRGAELRTSKLGETETQVITILQQLRVMGYGLDSEGNVIIVSTHVVVPLAVA